MGFNSVTTWIQYLHAIALFTRSGISLLTAHQLIAKQDRFQTQQHLLWSICQLLSEGNSYSLSLKPLSPPILIRTYLHMGEQSGHLDTALEDVHAWLKRKQHIKQQCIQAMIYPCTLLALSLIFILGMVFWMIPKIIEMYRQVNAQVPEYLYTLVHTVTLLHCLLALSMLTALVLSLQRAWRSEGSIRLQMERIVFSCPGLGTVLKVGSHAQYCELLGMACRCGLPLPDALTLLWQQAPFLVDRQAWGRVHTHVMLGTSLSEAMRKAVHFDNTLIELIGCGELSGRLDEQLHDCAIYYTESFMDTMNRFKEVIQPAMMFMLGIILGGWVLLIYYPIIQVVYQIG